MKPAPPEFLPLVGLRGWRHRALAEEEVRALSARLAALATAQAAACGTTGAGTATVLKRDRRVLVARLRRTPSTAGAAASGRWAPAPTLVGKRWCDAGLTTRLCGRARRRAERAWRGTLALAAHGIPTPAPWALVCEESGAASLLMADLAPAGVELDRVLAEFAARATHRPVVRIAADPPGTGAREAGDEAEGPSREPAPSAAEGLPARLGTAPALFVALGRLLAALEAAGLWHRDLKTCNVALWPGGGGPAALGGAAPLLGLLDAEDVVMRPPRARDEVRALAQIARSTPGALHGHFETMLAAYWGGPPKVAQRRRWERALARACRRPLLYVSRAGDVTEPWPR